MTSRPLLLWCARLVAVGMLSAGCGSANDLGVGNEPSSIPLLETTEATETTAGDTARATSTSAASSTTSDVATTTTSLETTTSALETTTTTAAPITTVPLDPFAAYCSTWNPFVSQDSQIQPGDPEGTAALIASQEAAWNQLAALAPAAISGEVAIVRSFTTAFRQLLADYDYDIAAAFMEVVELETLIGAADPRIQVEQFGWLECGTEAATPQEETAVFYASLLDTAERRIVLAELLSTDGTFTLEGAMCFTPGATVDMMFPLAGAPSTAAQEASFGQALDACQITLEGS